jgi:hypothetical protein
MFRKLLALLLLPCVLMSQSAVFGHAHGGSEPAGHELRPHLHASRTSHGHAHSHEHGDEGHHHHHGTGHHAHDQGDQRSASDSQPVTPAEHDSDAVYLQCVDAVVASRVVAELEFPQLWDGVFDSWTPPDVLAVAQSGDVIRCAHAPPLLAPSCPLYLRQLTLLI